MRRNTAMLALFAVLVAGGLAAAVPAYADEEAWTGLRDASAVVADLAHGHLFVSEGSERSRVAVTDLQGALVTTITGLAGPAGMALSPDGRHVDVALARGQGIARVDTTTLAVTATLPVPAAANCPRTVAESGGKVWFVFGCPYLPAGFAKLDLTTGQVQVLPQFVPGTTVPYAPVGDAQLLTSPARPNVLVAVTSTEPAEVYEYDTSSAAAPTVTWGLRSGGFALSPDATTLYDGTVDGIYVSPLSSAASQSQLSPSTASALSLSPDGSRLVLGRPYGGLCVLDAHTGASVRCREQQRGSYSGPAGVVSLGGDAAAMTAGASWPDALHQGPPGAWLEVLDDPSRAPTRLNLSTPDPWAGSPRDDGHSGQVTSGTTVTIQGHVSAPDTAGMVLAVTRRGPVGPEAALLPAVPDADGSFTLTDTPLAAGRYRYTVRYPGSPTQSPSTAEYDLDVQPPLLSTALTDNSQPSDLLDDPVHHRVFVAESAAGDVRAFDELGRPVAALSGLSGVSDLLLSADSTVLYAALPGADEVVALDPVSLTLKGVWPTGTVHRPSRLAVVGSRMLVGYRGPNSTNVGGIAAFDPSSPVAAVTPLTEPNGGPTTDPVLLADPAVPNGLLAMDSNAGDSLFLYVVGPTSLSTVAETTECVQPPTLSVDQRSVYCGGLQLDAATLSWQRALGMHDVTAAGDLLAGVAWFGTLGTSPEQLRVQPLGADDYVLSGASSGGSDVLHGTAWSADRSGVFSVWSLYGPGDVTHNALYRLDALPAVASTLTASVTASAPVGSSTVVGGALATDGGQPLVGATLHLLARGPAGTVQLPAVVTGSDGSFSTTFLPDAVGTTTYEIRYDGQLHQAPAAALVSGEVVRRTGAAALTASATEVDPGQGATLTLAVAHSHGSSTASLTTTSSTGMTTSAPVPVTGGTARFSVTPAVDSTYTVSWSGDDWDTPASAAPITVAVRPASSLLSVPTGFLRGTSTSVTFASNDPEASATCVLDGAARSCASPLALSGLAQGHHTLTVSTRSAAGAVGAPVSADWFVDSVAPRVTTATLSLLGSTGVVARWSGSDPAPASGIDHYVVTVTNQAGTVVARTRTSATSLTVPAAQGSTYRLAVVAVDRAGSSSLTGTANATMPVDDRHFVLSDSWSRISGGDDFGGSVVATRLAGKTARYSAAGRRYVLWVTTCPSCGRATVTIGGVSRTLDLYSATTHHGVAVLVYTSTTSARRTVTIKATGTRRTTSSGTWVRLDALQTFL